MIMWTVKCNRICFVSVNSLFPDNVYQWPLSAKISVTETEPFPFVFLGDFCANNYISTCIKLKHCDFGRMVYTYWEGSVCWDSIKDDETHFQFCDLSVGIWVLAVAGILQFRRVCVFRNLKDSVSFENLGTFKEISAIANIKHLLNGKELCTRCID